MVITCPSCENGRIIGERIETDDAHEHVAVKCLKCGWTHTYIMYGAARCPSPSSLAEYFRDAAECRENVRLADIISIY
jgi:RNase P subunit RPR2